MQEVKREKMLVERLMRQCQQERRITTQLMHIRKEKDTIRNNRILRQKQYAEQRELEFQQTLDREAVSAVHPLTDIIYIITLFLIAGAGSVGGKGEEGTSQTPQENVSEKHGRKG